MLQDVVVRELAKKNVKREGLKEKNESTADPNGFQVVIAIEVESHGRCFD